jgi:hypothetical protein
MVKSKLSKYVRLSSFESELESLNTTLKLLMWIKGVVEGLIGEIEVPIIFADNEAVIKFVKGEVEIKSAKHMEIKMYHAMEEYEKKTFVLEFMSGDSLPADLLTKVSSRKRFSRLVNEVQGEEDHGYSLDSEDE